MRPSQALIRCCALAALGLALLPRPAAGVLDINDRGPSLNRTGFILRVTNAGIIGNAFLDRGLSNDPSFESPPGSGQDLLNFAALWVGARSPDGATRVSGGPILEFRPTLDADDHVRIGEFGQLGTRRFYDDDGDRRVDEEVLNGRDDDGDFEVDEDLGMFAQQEALADYVDDRPEAVNFVYPGGEIHVPFGLSVHQEAYAWSAPGYDRIAGLSWTITNHGTGTLRDVYVGLFADLDSKLRTDRAGHLNDRVVPVAVDVAIPEPPDTSHTRDNQIVCRTPNCGIKHCFYRVRQTVPAVVDAAGELPGVAVIPLWHTLDPLALALNDTARSVARAPGRLSVRSMVFANGRPPGQGGVPYDDNGRYAALRGDVQEATTDAPGDYVVLLSCGPFPVLAPGQSVEFHAALVAGNGIDSLAAVLGNAAVLEKGVEFNRLPDYAGADSALFTHGETGRNGHEVCLEPPPGVRFMLDPHCSTKFLDPQGDPLFPWQPVPYEPGRCIWTDVDCDGCTGQGGFDTFARWRDPGFDPPAPGSRATPLDHAVRIEWDNAPETFLAGGSAGTDTRFLGYHVWKLGDWRERPSLVPPAPRWSLVGNFGPDTSYGQVPLASITDTTLGHLRILYEQPLYPVGRYAFEDHEVLNGFDYLYAVTSVAEITTRDADGTRRTRIAETALASDFSQRVVPRADAHASAKGVWVVPNPFRAAAEWDRRATYGDELTRHLDFMGLPRARCTIRIYTVAGDFVAQVDHDGRSGDGEASWDLVSRNGQEISSGIYLFTVNSVLGHSVGRFVVVR